MKTRIIFSCVVLFAALFNMAVQAMDKDRVVELKAAKDATIAFRIVFNAGSQYDPVGKEGLSYLTSRMLSEGSTTKNSYDSVLKKLFPFAAGYDISLSREISVFTGRVHKDNLKPYLALFTEQMLMPAFKADELERVRQDALNYLTNDLRYSSDEELGKASLYNSVYKGTAYSHVDVGTVSGLTAITMDDIKSFYNTYYNRSNFTLGIGGGYDAKTLETVWKAFEKLPEGKKAIAPVINTQKVEGYKVLLVEKKAAATAISMGFPIDLVRGSKDWYALAIANSWLGEHRNSSSHLYQVIRERRGLNYGDYSYIEHYPNGGRVQLPMVNVPRRHHLFEIWIRPVPNETAHFALRAALREYQALVAKGMSKDEFELTRKFLKNYVLQYAPTSSKRLGYALDDKFYGIKNGHIAMYREMMDKVTLEDVNNAIKKYLQDKNMAIAMICDNAAELKKNLASNVVSPMKYTSPKADEILKEDELISTFKLPILEENIQIVKVDEMFK
ncbi:MAG: insulinase family protein [Ignavibacteriales bacterium]|nr:insulinase family protein [Ignavibacteriales bacterium]